MNTVPKITENNLEKEKSNFLKFSTRQLKLLVLAPILALSACKSSEESKIEELIENYSNSYNFTYKGEKIKSEDASELASKLYECFSNHKFGSLFLHTHSGGLQDTQRQLFIEILEGARSYCDDFEKKGWPSFKGDLK